MSQGWLETRIGACERTGEYLLRLLQDLTQQLRSAQQGVKTAGQQYPVTSIGTTGGSYFCQPSAGVSGAAGTWPSVTPVSFTANVYQGTGGALSLVATGATVWNYCGGPLVASKTVPCIADGAGSYAVYTQSCV